MICTIANGCAMRRVQSKMRWRLRHCIAAMRDVPKGDDVRDPTVWSHGFNARFLIMKRPRLPRITRCLSGGPRELALSRAELRPRHCLEMPIQKKKAHPSHPRRVWMGFGAPSIRIAQPSGHNPQPIRDASRLVSSGKVVASANYVLWLAWTSNSPLLLAGNSRVRILPRWEAPANRLSEFTF